MPSQQLKQLSKTSTQTIVIGVAAIVVHAAQADSMMDDILAFVFIVTIASLVRQD